MLAVCIGACGGATDHLQCGLPLLPPRRAGPLVRHHQHDRLWHLREALRLPQPEQEELHHRQVRHQDPGLHQRLYHLPIPWHCPYPGRWLSKS